MEFYIWEFGDDIFMQELAVHSIAMHLFHGQVDKVALLLMDDIVITDKLLALLRSSNFIKVLIDCLRERINSKADLTFHYEIHLRNVLIFFVNYFVNRIVTIKFSRH
jgi:hypothetical protein